MSNWYKQASLKDKLIKLGKEEPDLRDHLRPVLDKVSILNEKGEERPVPYGTKRNGKDSYYGEDILDENGEVKDVILRHYQDKYRDIYRQLTSDFLKERGKGVQKLEEVMNTSLTSPNKGTHLHEGVHAEHAFNKIEATFVVFCDIDGPTPERRQKGKDEFTRWVKNTYEGGAEFSVPIYDIAMREDRCKIALNITFARWDD